MGKLIAVILAGFVCSGCTVSSLADLPNRAPGELFIICDDGQMYINNGDGDKACTGFMKADEKPKFK